MSSTVTVFVVNLDADRARLRRIDQVLAHLSMPYVRWPAIPGEELDLAALPLSNPEPFVDLHGFDDWSANEAACAVSHIRLLRDVVAGPTDWAVVLEDDAIPRVSLPTDVSEWDLPPDADIVLLNERARGSDTVALNGRLCSYSEVTGGAGTEGYLVSRRGAEKLLDVLCPLYGPLDFQMYAHFESVQRNDVSPYYWRLPLNPTAADTSLRAYKTSPSLVLHAGTDSSIGNARHPRARRYCELLLGMSFSDRLADQGVYPSLYNVTRTRPTAQVRRDPVAADVLYWKGVDIAHYSEEARYRRTSTSSSDSLFSILRDHAVNIIRVPTWVSQSSVEWTLHVARQAAAHGLQTYLALHYSDSWTDPTSQAAPASWSGLSPVALRSRVHAHTHDLLVRLRDQGTPPVFFQPGNEVSSGLLWPAGAVRHDPGLKESGGWATFSELFNAAVEAARSALRDIAPELQVVLHLDDGANVARNEDWVREALRAGLDFDCIGLSYHALWNPSATIASLPVLTDLAAAFPFKDLLVVEAAHPSRPFTYEGRDHFAGEFPFTPAGQADYLRRLLAVLRSNGSVTGAFWWAGAALSEDERCPDHVVALSLFDKHGVVQPSLVTFMDY